MIPFLFKFDAYVKNYRSRPPAKLVPPQAVNRGAEALLFVVSLFARV
jgi:hypothetical protein